MNRTLKVSRKKFFKYLLYSLSIPLIISGRKLITSTAHINNQPEELIIPSDIPNGISVRDTVLIYKDEKSLKFYSAKCSHLGCRITKVESDQFICPCHGSRFDKNGMVKEGPAYKSLTNLDYTVDKNKNTIKIKLHAKI